MANTISLKTLLISRKEISFQISRIFSQNIFLLDVNEVLFRSSFAFVCFLLLCELLSPQNKDLGDRALCLPPNCRMSPLLFSAVVSLVKNFDLETFLQLLPFSFPLLRRAFGWSVLGEGGRMPKVF